MFGAQFIRFKNKIPILIFCSKYVIPTMNTYTYIIVPS